MDYEKLLEKYIRHVQSEEGVTFLSRIARSEIDFTKEEIETLNNLRDKIDYY